MGVVLEDDGARARLRPLQGASQPKARRWERVILAFVATCFAIAEVWMFRSSAVPWLLDKAFFAVCLAFQALLAGALLPGTRPLRLQAPRRLPLGLCGDDL